MTRRDTSSLMRPLALPDSVSSPVVTPLSPSVVYASRSPDELDEQYDGDLSGYTYAREGHPNADVLAGLLDRMESAQGGFVTGSGMAAVSAVLMGLMSQGDHVLGVINSMVGLCACCRKICRDWGSRQVLPMRDLWMPCEQRCVPKPN